jgi:hypothetical protein
VDRLSRYKTLDPYDLFKIPIPDLLKVDAEGGRVAPQVVAVWITNKDKIKKIVVEKLFAAWDLELVGHWYWLKVRKGF